MKYASRSIGYRITISLIEERGSGRREVAFRELAHFEPRPFSTSRDVEGQPIGPHLGAALDIFYDIPPPTPDPTEQAGDPHGQDLET